MAPIIQADTFVGSLAIGLGVVLAGLSIRSQDALSQLTLVKRIQQRFGRGAARAVITVLAVLLCITGVLILRDIRPSFAVPQPAPRAVKTANPSP